MARITATIATLFLCYLGACFVLWEFPVQFDKMGPGILWAWTLTSIGLALAVGWLIGGTRR